MSDTVSAEDVMPVRSRICWGPILAGSMVALVVYFLLTFLGGALGYSISSRTTPQTLAIAAGVYAIVALAAAVFIGGMVASQLTVGENRAEGGLYGLLVGAAVFAVLLWLMATGVKSGFNAMVSVAAVGSNANVTQADLEANAREMGFTPAEIENAKQRARENAAQVKLTANDPETQRQAAQAAITVAWMSFAGTVVALLAAICGGRTGAGPTFRLIGLSPLGPTVGVRRRVNLEMP